MMPYAYYYDVPSTPEMYRAVTAEIGDQRPVGLISHLVVHENDGLRHYGVWERRTDWEQYRDDVIRPAVARVLRRAGIPEPALPDEHPLAVIDIQTG
jgi:hypothetical protein